MQRNQRQASEKDGFPRADGREGAAPEVYNNRWRADWRFNLFQASHAGRSMQVAPFSHLLTRWARHGHHSCAEIRIGQLGLSLGPQSSRLESGSLRRASEELRESVCERAS